MDLDVVGVAVDAPGVVDDQRPACSSTRIAARPGVARRSTGERPRRGPAGGRVAVAAPESW